jgi:RND family efflux transporter MFP subunit
VSGTVLQVFAEPGQRVKKGQVLAQLEELTVRDQMLAARSAARAAEDALAVAKQERDRTASLASAGSLAKRDLERAESAVASQEAMAADARSRLVSAERFLRRTRPRAPFDGVVSDRPANAGDIVQPGAPLFTVVDPASMRLEAAVPAEHLAKLEVGTRVDFTVSGYPGRTFEGRIELINPAVDPSTGQVRIYATVPNEGGPLLAGLFAKGRVVATAQRGLAVPSDAVDLATSPATVLRVKDGKVEKVPVELGLKDVVAELVEVRSGLAIGEVVVLSSARASLSPGTPVRLAKSGESPKGR